MTTQRQNTAERVRREYQDIIQETVHEILCYDDLDQVIEKHQKMFEIFVLREEHMALEEKYQEYYFTFCRVRDLLRGLHRANLHRGRPTIANVHRSLDAFVMQEE